ncbi:MAG: hypothetical protein ABL958_08300 [Bdellovibrionia bacterium]
MKWIPLALIFLYAPFVFPDAQVLPPGVRAFVYRRAQAHIPSRFDAQGEVGSYAVQKALPMSLLRQIVVESVQLLDEIKKSDPKLESQMTLGEIDMKPEINVEADGIALAWGLFPRFMMVGSVPLMRARVGINGGFQTSDSIQRTAQALRNMSATAQGAERDKLSVLAQFLGGVGTLRGEHLQHLLVNYYGYKPIGEWSASGIGDAQLYGQYLLHDNIRLKNAMKLGADLPTGRANDPDNIVDVPFGKGYYGTFMESMNDLYVFGNDSVILFGNVKFTHNWPTTQTMRLSPNPDMPLTSEKDNVRIQPGSSWTYTAGAEARLFWDIRAFGNYYWYNKKSDTMTGSRQDYDYGILSTGTDSHSQTSEVGAFFQTTDLYLQNRFPVPFKIKGSYSQTVAGANTEMIDMTYLEFQLYF